MQQQTVHEQPQRRCQAADLKNKRILIKNYKAQALAEVLAELPQSLLHLLQWVLNSDTKSDESDHAAQHQESGQLEMLHKNMIPLSGRNSCGRCCS